MLTTIRYIIITLFFAVLSTNAYAACSSPAGVAGEHGYNETGTGQYEYCDGTDWIIMEESSANILGPTSGLIAYWRMDETTGSTIKDSVGSYDGTWIDTENSNVAEETEKGKYGRAIAFDDNDKMTTTLKIGTLPNKTYAGWFYVDSSAPFWNTYLLQGDSFDSSTYVGLTGSDNVANSFFLVQAHTGGTDAEYCGDSSSNVPTGQWFHYAGSIDKANNTMKVYINGELFKTCNAGSGISLSGNTFYEPSLGVQVGADGSGGSLGGPLNGKADDLRIYNRTLSDAEVKNLFLVTPSLEDGLIGHWQLNELMGNTAFDLSGDGHHGAIQNFDPLTGSIDGIEDTAFDFETDNSQYINLGNVLNIPSTTPLTISAWVKPESVGTFDTILGNFSVNQGYRLTLTDGHSSGGPEVAFTQRDSSNNADYANTYTLPNGTIKLGEWQHIAVTYNGTTSVKIYVNGVEKDSTNSWSLTRATGTADLLIGQAHFQTREFDGGIDDVRMYDRALSASEIGKLYGLAAHYKMDETSGTVATDSSGKGNDGTMSGGLSGTNSASGKINNALNFDGTNDWIDVPPVAQPYMGATGSFTLSTWMKADDFMTAGAPPILYSEGQNSVNDLWVWGIREDSGVYYTRIGWNGGPVGSNSMFGFIPVTEGKWHHVAVTKSGTNYTLYVDGVLDVTGNNIRNPPGIIHAAIGKQHRGTATTYDYEFDGLLDDFKIHAYALSAEDIFTLYSCSGPGVMDYNPYSHIYQWCDANYDSFDVSNTTGAGGGGCAASGSKIAGSEGAMQYDTTNDKMVYCGGSSWIDIPN